MKVGVAGESGDVGGKLKFLFFNFFSVTYGCIF